MRQSQSDEQSRYPTPITNHVRNQFISNIKSETKPVTDKAFLTLFLLIAIPIWLYCMSYAATGNPQKILHGVNYNGRYCGMKEESYDLTEYPYVFWPQIPGTTKLALDTPICVKECYYSQDTVANKTVNYPIKSVVKATDGSDMTTFTIHRIAVPVYDTYLEHNMFCLPHNEELREEIGALVGTVSRQFTFAVGSIYSMRWVLFLVLLFVLVLCTLISRILVQGYNNVQWIFFSLAVLSLSVLGLTLIIRGVVDLSLSSFLAFKKLNDIFCLIFGILLLAGAFIYFVKTFTQAKKIQTGMNLLYQSYNILVDNLSLSFGPLFIGGVQIFALMFWITKAAEIISNGSSLPVSEIFLSNSVQGSTAVYGTRNILSLSYGAIIAFVLWCIWGCFSGFFFVEVCTFATNWVTSLWYWTNEEPGTESRDIGISFAFTRSAVLVLAKHFASTTLRSILTAILYLPVALLHQFGRIAERDGTGSINGFSPIAKFYRNHLEWVIDSTAWLEFIKNSSPTSIIQASKDSFSLKASAPRSMAECFDASLITARMGEIFVASISTCFIWLLINRDNFVRGTSIVVLSPLAVAVVTFIFTSYLAMTIVRVPANVVETELYCLLHEARKNAHMSDDDFYAPKHLKQRRKEASIVDEEVLIELAALDDKGYISLSNVGQSFLAV